MRWPERLHMVWLEYDQRMGRCNCGHPESHQRGVPVGHYRLVGTSKHRRKKRDHEKGGGT